MTTSRDQDPWRGIRKGDRFYLLGWNAREGDQFWLEVTDLFFDPVRGQSNHKRGYMVAFRMMGIGPKRALAAATIAGKGYRNVVNVESEVSAAMEKVFG